MEENNKMIMDDVVSTQVSDTDIANAVANGSAINNTKQFTQFRKTRTFIRIYNKKVGRNDSCPCGSGKKFKNCCLGNSDYNETRELNQNEMQDLKFGYKKIDDFKKPL